MSQRHPTARGRNANNDDTGTPVAAFDLDGTILWADAFTTFLRARVSRVEFWSRMAPLTPLFTAYVLSGEGRSRVKEWIERYGDPRDPKVDPIDWVERIPFPETRNYVQRIIESIQVYRVLLRSDKRLLIEEDLTRGTLPRFKQPATGRER